MECSSTLLGQLIAGYDNDTLAVGYSTTLIPDCEWSIRRLRGLLALQVMRV